MSSRKAEAKADFDSFYFQFYGPRWEKLKASFSSPRKSISLSDELLEPYFMDEASVAAVNCLPVCPGNKVLDMCAAPGGKTLALALKLKGSGLLVANDRSSARRSRLRTVLETSLPEVWKTNIRVTSHDSAKWGLHEQNLYDAVLLDAPCSSERHVFNSPPALAAWSPSRPRRLAVQQFAMLAGALDAAKSGGYILYCTCSVNPMENQEAIAKLMKRRPGAAKEAEPEGLKGAIFEKLDWGRIIMPDVSEGLGPLYFCLLRKT